MTHYTVKPNISIYSRQKVNDEKIKEKQQVNMHFTSLPSKARKKEKIGCLFGFLRFILNSMLSFFREKPPFQWDVEKSAQGVQVHKIHCTICLLKFRYQDKNKE